MDDKENKWGELFGDDSVDNSSEENNAPQSWESVEENAEPIEEYLEPSSDDKTGEVSDSANGKSAADTDEDDLTDEDDEIAEEEAYLEKMRRKRFITRNHQRRLGVSGGIMYLLFVIGASVLLAAFGWICAADVLAFGRESSTVEVTIEENATLEDISATLKNAGLINYRWLFELYGKFSHADQKVEPGTYELNTVDDYRAVVALMQRGSSAQKVVTVMIPEGYTMREIFELLEENGVCSADDLYDSAANTYFDYTFLDLTQIGDASRLEGYLFPDTYDFYAGEDPDSVISRFLNNAQTKFTDELLTEIQDNGQSLQEIITIASLIEAEVTTEREDAASVIYNRLEANMPLQLDSTINYAIEGTDQSFDLELDSPYNTYKYSGLPAGPICNPGMASINAAINPNDTDYYYFALCVDGSTRFFTNSDSFYNFVNSDEYQPAY